MELNVEEDRIELRPDGDAVASIIWLHGLGADGYDFEGVVPMLDLPAGAAVRFVFPHAPVQPVTLNGGMEMPSWFDIHGIGPDYPQDDTGVRTSAARVERLIELEQQRGVAPERVVLAGFSQGGAVVLHAGLRSTQPVAGILALSTWLPLAQSLPEELQPARCDTPILMLHGSQDSVVPLALAERSRQRLDECGCNVQFRTFPMDHAIGAEELGLIGRWLRERLSLD